MSPKAFQDCYPDDVAHCFGCGHLNRAGHQIKTHWDGERTITRFTPRPEHTAVPGFVYGGLLASLIDCHSTGSGAAALARARGEDIERDGAPRCVTGSLEIRYVAPTPLGPELEIRGFIEQVKGRKVVVRSELYAEGVLCVTGQAVVIEMPAGMAGKA
jgi:acyl-coenzyme A thioesterase PaaI-like protein